MRLFILATLTVLTLIAPATAQQNALGVKAGVIDVESFGEFGYNLEFSFEHTLKVSPRLSCEVSVGLAKENTFPDYFYYTFMFARENDVPQVVDDKIRSLTYEEAFLYGGFSQYNNNYLRLALKYHFITLLAYDVKVFSGLFLRNQNGASFDVYQFSIGSDGYVSDYRSNYLVYDDTHVGWPLGLEVNKSIGNKWTGTADALYQIPFSVAGESQTVFVNLFIRIGVAKSF